MHSLGNATKDFSASNMKKTGLYRTVYDFSADYGAISDIKCIKHSINIVNIV